MTITLRLLMTALLVTVLAACNLLQPDLPATARPRRPTRTPAPQTAIPDTPIPTLASGSAAWTDESAVMAGICFESAFDAAGRTFTFQNEQELTAFFDLADNSALCRLPVSRGSFTFSENRVLAGLWSKGVGCNARHMVDTIYRDDEINTIYLYVRFITEGTCTYELVRPFWVGLADAAGYNIQIVMQ